MSKDEFVELFKYRLALIPVGKPTREGFDRYMNEVSYMRSYSVYQLRQLGLRGWERARYNNAVHHLVPDWKMYLYKINKNCQLCGFPIATLKEATIDHIQPRAEGGGRGIYNQQLAHGYCNVLKSADFNKKTGQHQKPRTCRNRLSQRIALKLNNTAGV